MRKSVRSVESSSVAAMMVVAAGSVVTRRSALRIVRAVAGCFFLPQYETVLWPARRPLVCVDDPLDRIIPFRPERVQTYLGFVHLWIKSCHYLYRTFGGAALPRIREFVDGITRLYLDAARVYLRCQSTTTRPRMRGNPRLRLVRFVDPHVHCVPSLHVMIVVFTWFRMRAIVAELQAHREVPPRVASSRAASPRVASGRAASPGGTRHGEAPRRAEALDREIAYLRKEAVAITESVLYIKQHSVNCVPAALFSLHQILHDFTPEEGERFLDELFAESSILSAQVDEIQRHMKEVYRRFLESPGGSAAADQVILDFLHTRGIAVVRSPLTSAPEPSRLPVS